MLALPDIREPFLTTSNRMDRIGTKSRKIILQDAPNMRNEEDSVTIWPSF